MTRATSRATAKAKKSNSRRSAPVKAASRVAKKPPRVRRLWTASELKQVLRLVKKGTPSKEIAETLGRSLPALYVKASQEGISLKRG